MGELGEIIDPALLNEGEGEGVNEEGSDEEGNEEVEGEEADDENDGNENAEPQKVEQPQSAAKFEASKPPVPQPVSKREAFEFFRKQAVVAVLKNSNFEVSGPDDPRIKDYLDKLTPTDYEAVKKFSEEKGTIDADEYERTNIKPYVEWNKQERVKSAVYFVTREFPDVGQYKEEMKAVENEFWKRNPELLDYPEVAIPMLLMKAKELRMKNNGVPMKKGTKKRKPPAMEVSGSSYNKRATPTSLVNTETGLSSIHRPIENIRGLFK